MSDTKNENHEARHHFARLCARKLSGSILCTSYAGRGEIFYIQIGNEIDTVGSVVVVASVTVTVGLLCEVF